jgi:ankyrin repeat protein
MKNGTATMQKCLFTLLLFCVIFVCTGSAEDEDSTTAIKAYNAITAETELQNLINSKDFEGALHRLNQFPEEASILVEVKDGNKIMERHMALHAAFLVDMPAQLNDAKGVGSMLKPQVDLILALLKENPKACAQKDLKKRNPLQLAVSSPKVPPKDIIEILIKIFPRALTARDVENRLPLHLAVINPMTSLENVQILLKAYPQAVNVQDEDDSLPIHLAAWGGNTHQAMAVIKLLHNQNPLNLGVSDGDSETVLSLMAKYGRTTEEAVTYVVDLDPPAVLKRRDELEGNTLLHLAVQSSHHNNTIYMPILKAGPDATKQWNRNGQLPLHVALRQCCSSPQVIHDLLNTYPKAARHLDGEGMLPLHHACSQGVSDISILVSLINAYPESVKNSIVPQGETSKLYPIHFAMRHTAEKGQQFDMQNEIITLLLKKYPSAAKTWDAHVGLYPFHYALITRRPVKILKKLMALTPDAVAKIIHIVQKNNETLATTALHMFASIAPTYLTPSEVKDMVKEILSYDPDCARQKDGNGRLPLHEVWATVTDYDFESRNAMVDVLLEINPHAVKVLDREKKSPLSYSLFQRDYYGFKKTLSLYPDAAKKKATDHSFPLHQLCDLGAKGVHTESIDKIMELLLEANPLAAFKADHDGNLPLHKLAESAGFDRIKKSTIQKVIEANPAATNATNLNDRQPLMMTIISATASESEAEPEFWTDMVDALLQTNPEAARRHAIGGKTAFSKVLFDINSLHPNRRREDDPLLYILQMLYKCHPQAVLAPDGRNRNGLHVIATLLGDMGGMTPDSWKEFAIQIMHDFPELGVDVDKGLMTPLFLYTLYLGDTAIGMRNSQDGLTTRYIESIGELLHEFIVLNPEALNVKDEFGLTPLSQITARRLTMARGSQRYNRSYIIKMMKRLLSRDSLYWHLASRFQKPLHQFKKNTEALDCATLKSIYKNIQKDLDSALNDIEVDMDVHSSDRSCKEDWQKVCLDCPDLSQTLFTLDAGMASLRKILDIRNKDESNTVE